MKKLGIALVGLGSYSTYQLAPAIVKSNYCCLAGIVTGTAVKASMWSRKYGIDKSNIYNYSNFDTIANNKAIDIVYIAVPAFLRAKFAVKAAKAGKHVICEKPMAVSSDECQKIIDACQDYNVKLAMGYRLHYDPYHKYLMQLRHNYKIKRVTAGFGFEFNDSNNWRLNKEMPGDGALLDLGTYGVQAACYITGKIPNSVSIPNGEEIFAQKDISIREFTFKLHFDDDLEFAFATSYSRNINYITVETNEEVFELENAFSFSGLKFKSPKHPIYESLDQNTSFIDDFALAVIDDNQVKTSGEMGLRDMRVIEAILQAQKKSIF